MNDVSEIAVCPLSSDAELVSQAKMLWDGIIRSSRDMIRYKFAIGGLVRIALTRARHDDAAVTRLATELTNACGKLILPQRLYEAARLHEAFAGREANTHGDFRRHGVFVRRAPDAVCAKISPGHVLGELQCFVAC